MSPRATSRLVVAVVRALLGWLLVAVGGVLLLGCYLGVSKEDDVARQLPYVVSGGFFGLALVGLGGALLVADRLESARVDQNRLAAQVEDLHTLIIASVPGTAEPAATPSARIPVYAPATPVDERGMAPSALDDGILYAVPTGRTFHRASCELLAGKPAQPVDAAAAAARALSPCSVCSPNPLV
jgi:hypothetical protein